MDSKIGKKMKEAIRSVDEGIAEPPSPAKGKLTKRLSINSQNFVICKLNQLDHDYTILKKIGEGSYGSVYRIRHKTLKLERALKKIKKQKEAAIEPYKEIEMLKQLDHRNILKIYEFYETKDSYLIVTDIFEGKELLDEITESEKLSEDIASAIVKEILLTLKYTHSKGIAHRDIKPDNILVKDLDSQLKLKIIDWGLAILAENKTINQVCGTPEYAAPEVFQGSYSVQCDMWSLGATIFVMLTGNAPFTGANTRETIQNVKRSTVVNLRKSGFLQLSADGQNFISSLIQKDPKKRMTSSQALEHPWIIKHQKKQNEPVFLRETLQRLKQFKVANHFGIAVVNLISNHFSTSEEKEKLEEIFSYLDTNGDGVLSYEELLEGYSRLYGKALGEKIAEQTFSRIDVNNNGSLQFSQFVALGLEREKQYEKAKLREAFNIFDCDKNGKISWEEVSKVLSSKMDGVDEEDIKELMSEFDKNSDHQIDFEEFYTFITNLFERLPALSTAKKGKKEKVQKTPTKQKVSTSQILQSESPRVTRSTGKKPQ